VERSAAILGASDAPAEVPSERMKTPHDLLERVRAKRLVFTVTTGRSGTEYLSRALGLFRGVKSLHEPSPKFATYFRAVCSEPAVATEFWLERKLPRILEFPHPVYAETDHVACKGFLESLVELGVSPLLIHLRRPARDVAQSLWRLGTIPGRSLGGVRYYLSPSDRVFLPLDPARVGELHDYQLCYWYCLEIEERARVYTQRFAPRGVRLERVEFEEIRRPEGILELGEKLELGRPSGLARLQLRSLGTRRVNAKDDKKRDLELLPKELSRLEAEVEHLAKRSEEWTPAPVSRAPGRS
jgi:hypothetical protein